MTGNWNPGPGIEVCNEIIIFVFSKVHAHYKPPSINNRQLFKTPVRGRKKPPYLFFERSSRGAKDIACTDNLEPFVIIGLLKFRPCHFKIIDIRIPVLKYSTSVPI